MPSQRLPVPRVLSETKAATTLPDFLRQVLEYGIDKTRASGGTVFLFDGGTGRLEPAMTIPSRGQLRALRQDEGIVGAAFSSGRRRVLLSDGSAFGDGGEKPSGTGGSAWVAAIPAFVHKRPEAVFLLERTADSGPPSHGRKRSANLAVPPASLEALAVELESVAFGDALGVLRTHHVLGEMNRAGEGLLRLQSSIKHLITELESTLESSAAGRKPDMIYVQIVDGYRKMIRTIDGYGLPPSFGPFSSHTLGSTDVQAEVVTTREPLLIAGRDDARFDSYLFDKYHHERFVRLWVPLLVPPPGLPDAWAAADSLEGRIATAIDWSDESSAPTYLRSRGKWRGDPVLPTDRAYGVVEIGFLLEDPTRPGFGPFDEGFRIRCVAEVLARSPKLFPATIDGSLDCIVRYAASIAQARRTSLAYTLGRPEDRLTLSYPADGHVALMECRPARSGHTPAVELRFDDPAESPRVTSTAHSADGDAKMSLDLEAWRDRIRETAERSAAIAIRLHEALTAQYEVFDEVDVQSDLGTSLKSGAVLRLCEDACRVARADGCACYLFEEHPGSEPAEAPSTDAAVSVAARELRALGPPILWPATDASLVETATDWCGDALAVAQALQPSFRAITGSERAGAAEPRRSIVAAVPIDLPYGMVAVLALVFTHRDSFTSAELQDLVACSGRWGVRLSLWSLTTMGRFEEVMRRLRRRVADAGKAALELPSQPEMVHEEAFFHDVLRAAVEETGAIAAIVSLRRTTGGAKRVERAWLVRGSPVPGPHRHVFWNRDLTAPCEQAWRKKGVVLLRSGESETQESLASVLREVNHALSSAPRGARSDALEALLVLQRALHGSSAHTFLSCYVESPHAIDPETEERVTISLLLDGHHRLCRSRAALVLEVGRAVSDALAQVRILQRRKLEEFHNERVDERRTRFYRAERTDDIVGALFVRLGRRSSADDTGSEPIHWGLAEDAVLWRLGVGPEELLLRSVRGRHAERLLGSDLEVLSMDGHPLLRAIVPDGIRRATKGSESDRWTTSFRLQTHALDEHSPDRLLRTYARFGQKWLVTMPIVDAKSRVWGVLDLLRDEPIHPQAEPAVTAALHRFSRRFMGAIEDCLHRMVSRVDREALRDRGDSSISVPGAETLRRDRESAEGVLLLRALRSVYRAVRSNAPPGKHATPVRQPEVRRPFRILVRVADRRRADGSRASGLPRAAATRAPSQGSRAGDFTHCVSRPRAAARRRCRRRSHGSSAASSPASLSGPG